MTETLKSDNQKEAEAEVEGFRKELGPFVVAAETTRMAMVFTDAKEAENPIIFANDSFLKLSGYSREEVLGKSFGSLISADASPDVIKDVSAAFEGSDIDPEVNLRHEDGSDVWTSIFVNPVRDDAGAILQHFISFADLTKHRQEQAQSRMLIEELNHRVKNTLATVQSIVSQALRRAAPSEVIREFIESRLIALSRSHDLLTREKWEGVGLRSLINGALKPFEGVTGRTQHFVLTGKDIRLPAKTTLALGIALHELATNAVQYCAFSNEAGSIAVKWKIKASPGGERLFLCWTEKDGPPAKPPEHKGFGSQVIERGLAHELGANVHLDYRPEGLVCSVDFPIRRGTFDE